MVCLTGNKPRSTARSFIPSIDAYRGHSFDVKDGVPFLAIDCAPIDFAGKVPTILLEVEQVVMAALATFSSGVIKPLVDTGQWPVPRRVSHWREEYGSFPPPEGEDDER